MLQIAAAMNIAFDLIFKNVEYKNYVQGSAQTRGDNRRFEKNTKVCIKMLLLLNFEKKNAKEEFWSSTS